MTPTAALGGRASLAARPIDLGGGNAFAPTVLGYDAVPRITDPARAREAPDLAILSAVAHGEEADGEAVVLAVAKALRGLPPNQEATYYDLLRMCLKPGPRKRLEDLMPRSRNVPWAVELEARWLGEGLNLGMARAALRLLARRFGLLGEATQAQIEGLDLKGLEALTDALLDFTTLADLEAWLAARQG